MSYSPQKFKPVPGPVRFDRNDERIPITFSREQMLRLQYSKLINYFPDQLCPEWGGAFFALGNYGAVVKGWEAFSAFTEAPVPASSGLPLWIQRKDVNKPWAPDNTALTRTPNPELGNKFEGYMSINGSIVSIREAARFMLVDIQTVLDLKLLLLVDSAVIAGLVYAAVQPDFKEVRALARSY